MLNYFPDYPYQVYCTGPHLETLLLYIRGVFQYPFTVVLAKCSLNYCIAKKIFTGQKFCQA